MTENFAKFLKTNEITFKYAKGMRDIQGSEFHLFNEMFFFMGNEAEFFSETIQTKITRGTLIIIPKEQFHQFSTMEDESQYVRCVLQFKSIPELEQLIRLKIHDIRVFEASEILCALFYKLINLFQKDITEYERNILLKAVFSEILVEISTEAVELFNSHPSVPPYIKKIIKYISDNLEQSLSIDNIAKEFTISPSHLMHIFKNNMRTSLYHYIIEKKLIAVNHEIETGAPIMQAAYKYGFNDYPNFYRLYKKHFNMSPSKRVKDHLST